MERVSAYDSPGIFVLRVWKEPLGEGRSEWRGKVQDTSGGRARYFRDWSGLVACLERLMGGEEEEAADELKEEKEGT